MKKFLEGFSEGMLSKEQMKKVNGGGTPTIGAQPIKCWCPGAGSGWCAGDCKHCNGREGCF